jgi:hypothetical protein
MPQKLNTFSERSGARYNWSQFLDGRVLERDASSCVVMCSFGRRGLSPEVAGSSPVARVAC